MNPKDLHRMFGSTPPHFTDNLQRALTHIEEETPVKRITLRTVLLVGALLVLLTVAALAAINAPSIQDFYDTFYGEDSDLALHVAEQQSQPQQLAFSLPDVDITLTEAIFDGGTLYTTGIVTLKEDRNVVLICNNYLASDPAYLNPLYDGYDTVPEGHPTYAQVAAERDARLLWVAADVEAEGGSGSYMAEYLPLSEDSFSFIGEFPDALVRDGVIHCTLNASQCELTPQNIVLEDTHVYQQWTFTVPALAEEIFTPSPAPSPSPIPDDSTLIVVGGSVESGLTQAYLADHPGTAFSFPDYPWDEDGFSAASRLIRDNTEPWDILYVSTDAVDLPALMAEGYLAPLSGQEALSAGAARIYPLVQDALSHDGVLYAYPDWIWDTNWQSDVRFGADAWTAAGYTEADLPESISELYALLDGWLDLPVDQRPQGVIEDNGGGSPTRESLLEMLLRRYDNYLSAHGLPYRFDASTPFYPLLLELDALADRIEADVAAHGPLTLHGYSNLDTGSGVVLQPKYAFVPGDAYLRGTQLHVYIVNAKSPRVAQALAYLAYVPQATDADFLAQLYQDATYEEFPNTDLEADLEVWNSNVAHWEAEVAAAQNDADRADAQAAAERVTAYRDALIAFPYLVTQAEIDDFRVHDAPYLVFPSQPLLDTNAAAWRPAYELRQRYLAGELSAEAFADSLHAHAIEVEGNEP